MAFIDEIKIYAKAGNGGDGVVRFRHEKYREFGGPSGGDGGNGGDVYIKAVRDVHLLSKYRTKKEFIAENGEIGMKNSLHGGNGKDLEIELPIGSVITNLSNDNKVSLNIEGERILILSGGRGGYGNEHFKSSINRQPKESTPGKIGEESNFFIEVELIADIGLIGLPNAGKTSLLNSLTRAKGKIGEYPFTTLEPNLGEYFGYIISDIPGLIEGAASGKGLGYKFLRHIRRTEILVHLISLENKDLVKTYKTIRKELKEFDEELLNKKEIIVLTKTDLFDKKEIEKAKERIEKEVDRVYSVSILDDKSIKFFGEQLLKDLKNLK